MKDRKKAAESLIAFGMSGDIRASLGRWLPPCIHVTKIVSAHRYIYIFFAPFA